MAAIKTSDIVLPKEVASEIVHKVRDASVIQALSAAEPRLFKDIEHMVFTADPEAEFVGEGTQKGNTNPTTAHVPGEIHKAQVTIRMSDEVKWADEDNQLGIIDAIVDAGSAALGRALDYGVIHAINPATGATVSNMSHITSSTNVVTATSDPAADLDSLVEAVNEDYDVTGVALSKAYANSLRKIRVSATGARLYPEIPINLQVGSLDGISAATSSSVNGKLASTATGVMAVLGDFNMVKWGIVRDLGLQVIETGDPDGQGDLKRFNQVAYRLEMVYSWAIVDKAAFAILKAADEEGDGE